MNNIKVFVKLEDNAKMPSYMTIGSSGADLSSNVDTIVPAKSIAVVPTGISIHLPLNYEAQVRSRSGLAANYGIFVLNAPGTIDSDYRGEIKVVLANFSDKAFSVSKGDRIAQLVIAPVTYVQFAPANQLDETMRNTGGFGSTGV